VSGYLLHGQHRRVHLEWSQYRGSSACEASSLSVLRSEVACGGASRRELEGDILVCIRALVSEDASALSDRFPFLWGGKKCRIL